MPYKVALVSDIPGWSFHNIGKQIEKTSNDQILFKNFVLQNNDIRDLSKSLSKEFDLIHFFWRLAALESKIDKSKLTTAYYDHQFEGDERLNTAIFKSVSGIYTSSSKLFFKYQPMAKKFPDVHFSTCTDGVALEYFRHADNSKKSHQFKLLWVGNSRWGESDHKGLHSIFYPAIKIAQKFTRRELVPVVIDASVNKVPFSQMIEVYSSVDAYACTSLSEGTPNPLLEAMAAGLPFISTDVGLVPDLAKEAQRLFVCERSPEDFAAKIVLMEKNQNLHKKCVSINSNIILEFDWKVRAKNLRSFFESVLVA
jgi:glycosyltransferase involved in cell wall biosynthesis